MMFQIKSYDKFVVKSSFFILTPLSILWFHIFFVFVWAAELISIFFLSFNLDEMLCWRCCLPSQLLWIMNLSVCVFVFNLGWDVMWGLLSAAQLVSIFYFCVCVCVSCRANYNFLSLLLSAFWDEMLCWHCVFLFMFLCLCLCSANYDFLSLLLFSIWDEMLAL